MPAQQNRPSSHTTSSSSGGWNSRRVAVSALFCALAIVASFIEIPLFCVALELFIRHMLLKPMHITWSAVVLTVCTIIDFALLTILVKKRLRNEVRRRLHF